MDTKELTQLKKKVTPLIESATTYDIQSADDMTHATILLSELGRYYDQVVESRERITAPLNASLKAARDLFSPIEKPAKAAYDALRMRIGAYQTKATQEAAIEAAKIAERIAPGKGNLSFETALKKIDAIEKPEAKISTEAGSLKFRKGYELVITDETKIPRHYLMPNEKLILEDLKKGVKMYGAELKEIQIPVNSR